jgi:hypothetical protein
MRIDRLMMLLSSSAGSPAGCWCLAARILALQGLESRLHLGGHAAGVMLVIGLAQWKHRAALDRAAPRRRHRAVRPAAADSLALRPIDPPARSSARCGFRDDDGDAVHDIFGRLRSSRRSSCAVLFGVAGMMPDHRS